MRKNDFWLILVLLVLAAGSWFLFRSWWSGKTNRCSSGSN